MSELFEFGRIVLLVAAGFSLALASSKLTERFPLPGPAIFLLAAALASDLFPALADHTSIRQVERIGVVALIAILFDGGMQVGRRRFRASAVEIASLGVLGTFATAALIALAAHSLFGFSWTFAGILVVDALGMALTQRKPTAGVVHHSYRGSQYTSLAFGKTMQDAGVLPSMGAAARPSITRSPRASFATLETELLDRHTFRSRDQARLALFNWIEGFYNTRRRHSTQPEKYEQIMIRQELSTTAAV